MAVVVIAEAGVNHNGELPLAKELILAAKEAGADVVKFQTSSPSRTISRHAPKAGYQARATGTAETQREMLERLVLSEDAHLELHEAAARAGIEFLSTPFFVEGVDLLIDRIGLRRLKISSGEIVNGPLLVRAASKQVPLIVSTGMSTLAEVREALGAIGFGYASAPGVLPSRAAFAETFQRGDVQDVLREKVTLLHCTTEYPTPFSEVNLRAMDTLRDCFGLPVGLSDHSEGSEVAIAAVARGASVIEKHLTLDRALPGPDHQASIEPREFSEMVEAVRHVEAALGTGVKEPTLSERRNLGIVRKTLVAARPIKTGETFSTENLAVKRPSGRLSPMDYWDWIGTTAARDYAEDEPLLGPDE